MSKKLKAILITALLLAGGVSVACFGLSACGGGGGSDQTSGGNNPPPVVDPITIDLPPDPGETGKATLLGVDSNNNGVRDDVERWIASASTSTKVRAALTQTAKALQLALKDANDKQLSLQHERENTATYNCLVYVSGGLGHVNLPAIEVLDDNLRAQFLNTEARTQAYFAYDAQLSGGVYPDLPNDGSTCDFDPTDLPN